MGSQQWPGEVSMVVWAALTGVMGNSVCQLGWTRAPRVCSGIIPDAYASGKVFSFSEETNLSISGL